MDLLSIRNQCAHERIDPRLLPLVEAARAGVLACCRGQVREVRLQGSIARGDAQLGHADLDMIVLLDGPPVPEEIQCLADLAASLGAGTKLISRFDLEAVDANALEPFRRFVLSSDSLGVFGEDSLTLPVQTMERHALARLVTPNPATMLPDYMSWVDELAGADGAERCFACRIIGKDLLKVVRGVLLFRGAPYEVAIPRIAAQVPHLIPDAGNLGEQLFALYTTPTPRLEALREAVTSTRALVESWPEVALLGGAVGDSPAVVVEIEA